MRQGRLRRRETEEQQEDTFQGREGGEITKNLRAAGFHRKGEMTALGEEGFLPPKLILRSTRAQIKNNPNPPKSYCVVINFSFTTAKGFCSYTEDTPVNYGAQREAKIGCIFLSH